MAERNRPFRCCFNRNTLVKKMARYTDFLQRHICPWLTWESLMAKILILYYSSYAISRRWRAIWEGARATGADVVIKRVPELVPQAVTQNAGIVSINLRRLPR